MTNEYEISTDKSRFDVELIHRFLDGQSYWAKGLPKELIPRMIAGSLCFGVYLHSEQVGFARVISDFTTFAYLSDVFITETHRGKGLSKRLVQHILARPDLQGLRRFVLATRDAHSLYAAFGFQPLDHPEYFMQIYNPELYASIASKSDS